MKKTAKLLIVGQEDVRRQLAESLREGRAAHAYLFGGPGGIGKTAVALEFAQLLLCGEDGLTPCGTCDQCSASRSLQHPDLRIYFPLPPRKSSAVEDEEREYSEAIAKIVSSLARDRYAATRPPNAKEIRIKLVRAMLRSAALKPYQAKRKVFVILDAETMNDESQNALLKVLEEPYDESYFLLVTDNELLLKSTIRSRCQRVRMAPIPDGAIYDALCSEDIPKERAELAARLSGGSYRHARELSGQEIENVQENVLVFLRKVANCNPLELPEGMEALMSTRNLPEFTGLEMLGQFLRDAAILGKTPGRAAHNRLAFANREDRVQAFMAAYPKADFEKAVEVVDQSLFYLTRGYTKELVLYALAIQLHRALGIMTRAASKAAVTS
jgi:DNA polymerase-3 subunit delta'